MEPTPPTTPPDDLDEQLKVAFKRSLLSRLQSPDTNPTADDLAAHWTTQTHPVIPLTGADLAFLRIKVRTLGGARVLEAMDIAISRHKTFGLGYVGAICRNWEAAR